MIDRLIGQGSTVDQLKSGLSDSTRTVRGIAHRVASASARDGDFARALDDAHRQPGLIVGADDHHRVARRGRTVEADLDAPRRGGRVDALDDAQGAGAAEVVDMEQEMVSLAEEQIRFEAATSLLSKVYEQIRMGIRER